MLHGLLLLGCKREEGPAVILKAPKVLRPLIRRLRVGSCVVRAPLDGIITTAKHNGWTTAVMGNLHFCRLIRRQWVAQVHLTGKRSLSFNLLKRRFVLHRPLEVAETVALPLHIVVNRQILG